MAVRQAGAHMHESHGVLRKLSAPRAVIALALAYGLLGGAWVFGNPPFASPDESAHYVRAAGVSRGVFVGTPARDPNPALTPKQRTWTNQASRRVPVPAGLAVAGNAPCMSGRAASSAECLNEQLAPRSVATQLTSVGTYQPVPYVLPAAVLRLGNSAQAADRIGRLATVAVWWVLIVSAFAVLWDGSLVRGAAMGLVVAITPQVVFVGSTLNGSSLEIAASCAFFASLLRIGRCPNQGSVGRWVWVLAGLSGVLLACSRSIGPVWVLLALALAAVVQGQNARSVLWRDRRRALVGTGLVLGLGIVSSRLWETLYGPEVTTSAIPPLEALKAGRRAYAGAADQLVGNFGYLDTPLPPVAVWGWALLATIFVLMAARVARGRERLALMGALVMSVIGPMYLFAAVTRFTGFGLQGRHVLPLLVLLPLLAGEILSRNYHRAAPQTVLRWRTALHSGVVIAAAIQVLSWWTNARRYAVGAEGPWWFPPSAAWSPPGGWWPLIVVVLGAAVCVLVAVKADRKSTEPLAVTGATGST